MTKNTSDVVFVKTRWDYQSYTDFWKLVELSGFPIEYVDEVDLEQDVVYIVTPHNGEWKPVIDAQRNRTKRARLINWNLERPGGSGGLTEYIQDNQQLVRRSYFDEILVSDRDLAKKGGFSYAILGGHKNFSYEYDNPNSAKVYDLIHLSYNSPRRSFLFDSPGIPKKNLNGCKVAPNAWGVAKHQLLLMTKFMLNVHQDEHMYMEPLRFVLAAMYKLPILTEYCYDTFPYNTLNLGFNSNLLRNVRNYVTDYEKYIHIGEEMHKLMTEEYTFRHCIEVIL